MDKFLESRLRTVLVLVSIVSLVFSLGVAVGSDRDQLSQIQKRQEDTEKGLKEAVKGLNDAVMKLTESVARLEGRLAEKQK